MNAPAHFRRHLAKREVAFVAVTGEPIYHTPRLVPVESGYRIQRGSEHGPTRKTKSGAWRAWRARHRIAEQKGAK